MEKNSSQGKQQKSESYRSKSITLSESGKTKGSRGASSFERIRKGSAGDSTNSTGPRNR